MSTDSDSVANEQTSSQRLKRKKKRRRKRNPDGTYGSERTQYSVPPSEARASPATSGQTRSQLANARPFSAQTKASNKSAAQKSAPSRAKQTSSGRPLTAHEEAHRKIDEENSEQEVSKPSIREASTADTPTREEEKSDSPERRQQGSVGARIYNRDGTKMLRVQNDPRSEIESTGETHFYSTRSSPSHISETSSSTTKKRKSVSSSKSGKDSSEKSESSKSQAEEKSKSSSEKKKTKESETKKSSDKKGSEGKKKKKKKCSRKCKDIIFLTFAIDIQLIVLVFGVCGHGPELAKTDKSGEKCGMWTKVG